jgi:hypothetical protein
VFAQVRMPALTRWARRLSVAFAGGGGGADEPRVASEPANPTFVPLPSVASPGGALELRYDLFRGHAALLDVGAGARLKWPPVPYVRLRWLQAARVSHPLLLRLAPSAFWELDRGLGLRVELETHVALFSATVWKTRLSDAFTQLGPGLEWYAETGIQQLLDWRTVLYPAVAAAGATTALSSVGLSRIFVRARRDLYREWIYLELEPEVAWRADPSGQRLRSFGVILRLEVQLASLGTGSRWGP